MERRAPKWLLSLIKRIVIRALIAKGMTIQNGRVEWRETLQTVLVVTHEASETGAPILALNLCQELKAKANVLVLILKKGSLEEDFKRNSVGILMPKQGPVFSTLLNKEIRKLTRGQKPAYAIVNSVVSTSCLQSIKRIGIPTITLIHEFSSYIRPEGLVNTIGLWSNKIIFSTELTRNDLISKYPQMSGVDHKILPQGKCGTTSDWKLKTRPSPQKCVSNFLDNIRGDEILVLGAGAIQPRKGVDIFVWVADQLRKHQNIEKVKFVWIGAGYDPINDFNVSLWIKDQIERSGLENNVFMIDHSNEYKHLMERADIFLVTSRLDPLPNVAIDALTYGKPVMCFEKACGLESLYKKDELLRKMLLVSYLDTEEMAEKLCQLLNDNAKREAIGNYCKNRAIEWFDMKTYVQEIEKLGKIANVEEQKLNLEAAYLIKEKAIDMNYCFNGESNEEVCTQNYLNSWKSGIGTRKPFPGFHPGIYKEQKIKPGIDQDPLVDYIKSGRPKGEWNNELIMPHKKIIINKDTKTALHIHVHYIDLLGEICTAIQVNKINPDIYISYNDKNIRDNIESILDAHQISCNSFHLTPNRGRDIGPFLSEIGGTLDKSYDIYGHIHTKKSVHIDKKLSGAWREFLIGNLLGDAENRMMDNIIDKMIKNPNIGLVFPEDPHCPNWDGNYYIAVEVAKRIGIRDLPRQFNFPVGTMFWARKGALSPLLDLGIKWSDYPEEPIGYDGTLLHAIERLIPIICKKQGFETRQTYVEGINR